MNVRLASTDDLERVIPLFDAYRQFYGQTSDIGLARDFLAERLDKDESVILLAEGEAGDAVGFVQLYPMFSSVAARRIYVLNDLFVAPDARRRGVAALLLTQAAEFGRSMGAAWLSLSTAVDNESAQRLYESLGWRRDEDFYHYELAL